MSSSHRHERYGEGTIIGWFDHGMVMFKSNNGKVMLREESLSPLGSGDPAPLSNPQPITADPPELPVAKPQELEVAQVSSRRKSKPAKQGRVDLNAVEKADQISSAFPQFGKISAKRLFEKTPPDGWVSLNSVRTVAGELFPTEESWQKFADIFEVV